jgi:hypothetical protein
MQVEADCAYCILESIEWVCGKGCVAEKLHISTDYEVMPRPCTPELVEVLAASNAEHASAALRSRKPFGLTLPDEPSATDIFVPTGEDAHGAPAYRGVQRGDHLFRCLTDGPETWAIARAGDGPARDQCGGRVSLTLDINSSRARMGPADKGGIRFDSGFDACSTGNLESLHDHPEYVAESALHIACALVRSFGAHTVRGSDVSVPTPNVTIRFGGRMIGSVRLLGDLLVRHGESLRLEADDDAALAIVQVGARQVRVEAGGSLELIRVNLTRSTGSAAMRVMGTVVAVGSTFSDCVTGVDFVMRYGEKHTPPGPAGLPARGAALTAAGGVAFVYLSKGHLRLTRCVLEGNMARGPAVSTWGGAVVSVGAKVTVEKGTLFRRNSAGCHVSYGAFGGAIASVLSGLDVSHSTFSSNSAEGCSGGTELYVQGGALFVLHSNPVVRATLFESNVASSSSSRFTIGGAIRVHDGSNLTLHDSVLRENEVRGGQFVAGGAVGVEAASAVLSVGNTTFEMNKAQGGSRYTRGGALYVEKGRADVGRAVTFRSNEVSSSSEGCGNGAVGGGAVAVTEDASLSSLEAPIFEANRAHGPDPTGGAVLVAGAKSSAVIKGGIFENNTVTVLQGKGYGGAPPSRPMRAAERTGSTATESEIADSYRKHVRGWATGFASVRSEVGGCTSTRLCDAARHALHRRCVQVPSMSSRAR